MEKRLSPKGLSQILRMLMEKRLSPKGLRIIEVELKEKMAKSKRT